MAVKVKVTVVLVVVSAGPLTMVVCGASPSRTVQVKLAGVVRRITVRPAHGYESLEAVLDDGTGEIEAVWMGRRTISGLSLGTHLVVDGVLSSQPKGGRAKMVNPKFEFATPPTLK